MIIAGLQKVTLIDYPEKIACTVFTHGCNFRCLFCHNPELVIEKPDKNNIITEKEFFSFLNTRINRLNGVVITGGEPLLNPDLKDFIIKIKEMGFSVKLDTNGSFPEHLESLLSENFLLDYVAMDIKSDLDNYEKVSKWEKTKKIVESIELIKKNALDYEFRTTVVRDLHDEKILKSILKLIKGSKRFVIQNFKFSKTIESNLSSKNEFRRDELEAFSNIFKNDIGEVIIRNHY